MIELGLPMATYCVLVVDDHRETRYAYRANLELLDADLEVLDVPSGEEAIVEFSIQHIDLLIADVHLPGISGLELFEKAKANNPDLKVILVTGLLDANIRRQVADSNADAFFLKPVEMPDLLDAAERCLGLVEGDTSSVDDSAIFVKQRPTSNVSERLVGLRQELNAFSAVLLDDYGKVLACAGGLPDAVEKSQVLPTLMATFSVVNKVSLFLGKPQPEDLWYLSGIKYDLFWAHVGLTHGLLVAANPIVQEEDLAKVIGVVKLAGQDLVEILNAMGITSTVEVESGTEPIEEDLDMQEISEEDENEFTEMLQGEEEVVSDELNAYWDTATSEDENTGPNSADAISYAQARQLGLTPEDD